MTEFGACVVLVPTPENGLPDYVEGGQHITLAYFGDNPLDYETHRELLNTVANLAGSYSGRGMLKTKTLERFGQDGEAIVLTVDDSDRSEAVQIRQELLNALSPELYAIFLEAETFPDYRPHMTFGYLGEQRDEDLIVAHEDLPSHILFDSIAVWNGDERYAFKMMEHADELMHFGIIRQSGRYPWGSGKNPHQRSRDFMGMYDDLKKQGLSETEIAKGLGMNTRELRENKKIAKAQIQKAMEAQAVKLKDKGMSNVAIGEQMGLNESSVRALLNPIMKERRSQLENTADRLREQLANGQFLDVSEGTEQYLGVSRGTLKAAYRLLEDEGYKVQYLNIRQMTTGKDTKTLVLTPDIPYSDFLKQTDKIGIPDFHSPDGGKTWEDPTPPKSVNSKRLQIRYNEEGGADMDGVIELRPGAKDLSLGNNRYAQVRIAVDGSHYIKGMAVYNDDLPAGVDIRFNTNKTKKDAPGKLDALKPMSDDPANPWGAVIKAGGQRGAINIVNEEGDWLQWSKNLSSQMLSKQSPALAKKQLDLTYDIKKAEFDEINSLTNAVVKKHLLTKFADGADSSAVYLKAKGLPGTQNHVILPFPKMKETEVYAPQYKNGEKVVLIRHPHGGKFEIPELTVNNRIPLARKLLGAAVDAIGINPKVAEQLSGADFDGDTVLVIPNRDRKNGVSSQKPLQELKGFDPKVQYKGTASTAKMKNTQTEMGIISNLITDMSIQGASNSEIARAVKHSMVVIDAEKHGLNYKQSYVDNGIAELKKNYQNSARGGASTLISSAKSKSEIPQRELRKPKDGGPIDPRTGKKVYVNTGASYVDKSGKTIEKTQKVRKMELTDDAFSLVSNKGIGTPIEKVYATHANKLKAMANESRKIEYATKNPPRNAAAAKTYAPQVKSLTHKLNQALKNAPLERQAQLLAGAMVKQKRLANPNMQKDEIKKSEQKALAIARARTGAGKDRVVVTDREWEAIQAGAISSHRLSSILRNADLDQIKALATPRTNTVMSDAKLARAQSMLNAGYTQAEIADALGLPKSTVNSAFARS